MVILLLLSMVLDSSNLSVPDLSSFTLSQCDCLWDYPSLPWKLWDALLTFSNHLVPVVQIKVLPDSNMMLSTALINTVVRRNRKRSSLYPEVLLA